MAGFSKKVAGQAPTNSESSVDASEWNAWNEYQYSCFDMTELSLANGKKRKEADMIGVVNFIMDLGYPAAADSEWNTKVALPAEGEEYSPEELKSMEENPTWDYVWSQEWDASANKMVKKRKQTSPSYPQQEFGIAVDFPQVRVDYSKHPYSDSDEPMIRPYRVSLNGTFRGEVQRPIPFDGSFREIKPTNLVHKICTAAGRGAELVSSGYDIATAAEAVCNFQLRMDLSEGDKVFLNDSVSKPSVIQPIKERGGSVYSVEEQIEDALKDSGIIPFTGILLDGMEYTDEMLDMVQYDRYGFIKRAETSKLFEISGTKKDGEAYCFEKGLDYESTDFAKALAAFKDKKAAEKGENTSQSTPKQSSPQESAKTKAPEKVATPKPSEPELDDGNWDEDIPFAPIGLQYPELLLCM